MAFKSMVDYASTKYSDFFRLQNDGDWADVIFLYKGITDEVMASCHYIKSSSYSGYVSCLEQDCPVCAKKISIHNKIFIPLYVIRSSDYVNVGANNEPKICLWDRKTRFTAQLDREVMKPYGDPSTTIFKIIRHGMPNDQNTRYEIRAIGPNNEMSYEDICTKYNIKFPDIYMDVCKDYDRAKLNELLMQMSVPNSSYGAYNNSTSSSSASYGAVPRGAANANVVAESIPQIETPEISVPDLPNLDVPEGVDDTVPFNAENSTVTGEPSDISDTDIHF